MTLRPALARADFDGGAAVVAAAPVVEDDRRGDGRRVAVAEELDLGRPAAQKLDGRIDQPEADASSSCSTSRRRGFSNWTAV